MIDKSKGYDREALDCMDIGLAKRKEFFGVESKELILACKRVGQTCNKAAEKLIDEGKLDIALEYLKWGEHVTKNDPKNLQAIFNNMASLHRKKGILKSSLRYLELSLDLEEDISETNSIRRAQIHLNICATQSQLGKHKIALRHAESAIQVLEEGHHSSFTSSDIMNGLDLIEEDIQDGQEDGRENLPNMQNVSYESSKKVETLAIAYYNLGAEQEYLKEFARANICYQKGLKVVSECFPSTHFLVKILDESSKSITKKINNGIVY